LRQLKSQLESGELRENIHQLKCAKYREEFEKFVDKLFFFFFFYLTILQPDITGYRGRKKSTFSKIIFSQLSTIQKKK
jgi:hypothetical protein